MDALCSEDVQRVYDKKDCCIVIAKKSFFVIQLSVWTTEPHTNRRTWSLQLSLKCRLLNRIYFDVFGQCFCKVETRACETLRRCTKHLGGLAVTTLPRGSRSFNQALATPGSWTISGPLSRECSQQDLSHQSFLWHSGHMVQPGA